MRQFGDLQHNSSVELVTESLERAFCQTKGCANCAGKAGGSGLETVITPLCCVQSVTELLLDYAWLIVDSPHYRKGGKSTPPIA